MLRAQLTRRTYWAFFRLQLGIETAIRFRWVINEALSACVALGSVRSVTYLEWVEHGIASGVTSRG